MGMRIRMNCMGKFLFVRSKCLFGHLRFRSRTDFGYLYHVLVDCGLSIFRFEILIILRQYGRPIWWGIALIESKRSFAVLFLQFYTRL